MSYVWQEYLHGRVLSLGTFETSSCEGNALSSAVMASAWVGGRRVWSPCSAPWSSAELSWLFMLSPRDHLMKLLSRPLTVDGLWLPPEMVLCPWHKDRAVPWAVDTGYKAQCCGQTAAGNQAGMCVCVCLGMGGHPGFGLRLSVYTAHSPVGFCRAPEASVFPQKMLTWSLQ